MEQSTEIAPGIHRIAGVFAGSRIVFCHLLVGAGRSMLVDTGMSHTPQADIFPYMKSIGFDPAALDFVLITHSDIDHQAGNEEVRKAAPNALFIAHNLDVPWIKSAEALVRGRYAQFIPDHGIGPDEAGQQATIADCPCHVPIDIRIDGGEHIRLAPDWVVELVHTPGHTWGHTGLYDPRSKTFLAAEAALWNAILDKDWRPALHLPIATWIRICQPSSGCAGWTSRPIRAYTGRCNMGVMSAPSWMRVRTTAFMLKLNCWRRSAPLGNPLRCAN